MLTAENLDTLRLQSFKPDFLTDKFVGKINGSARSSQPLFVTALSDRFTTFKHVVLVMDEPQVADITYYLWSYTLMKAIPDTNNMVKMVIPETSKIMILKSV